MNKRTLLIGFFSLFAAFATNANQQPSSRAELTHETTYDAIINAAEAGSAHAQVKLGLMYEQGEHVEKSFDEAEMWFRLAANQDHPQGEYNLALFYIDGVSVQQDASIALYWLERAANRGYLPAILHLANYQQVNSLLDEDEPNWIRVAAERGDPLSQLHLAKHHLKMSMSVTDIAQAEFWLTNAAEHDLLEAQLLLVELYTLAKYQLVDEEKANFWKRVAMHTELERYPENN